LQIILKLNYKNPKIIKIYLKKKFKVKVEEVTSIDQILFEEGKDGTLHIRRKMG
jgi:hypothetical protein